MKGSDLKLGVIKFACRWESDLNFKDTQLELFKLTLIGCVELQHC